MLVSGRGVAYGTLSTGFDLPVRELAPGRPPRWLWMRRDREELSFRDVYAAGWPRLALLCDLVNPRSFTGAGLLRTTRLSAWGIPLPSRQFDPGFPAPPMDSARFLPLRPIPLNFAINTAFFAATWWMLTAVPLCGYRAVRRARRRRRGACIDCGYSHYGLPASVARCPECGGSRSG
jgi:hypothetical protein